MVLLDPANSIDRDQDGSVEAGTAIEAVITKLTADLERMAPNMKAMERCAGQFFLRTALTHGQA